MEGTEMKKALLLACMIAALAMPAAFILESKAVESERIVLSGPLFIAAAPGGCGWRRGAARFPRRESVETRASRRANFERAERRCLRPPGWYPRSQNYRARQTCRPGRA